MRDIRYFWRDGLNSVGMSNEVELPQFRVLGHRQRATEINLTTGIDYKKSTHNQNIQIKKKPTHNRTTLHSLYYILPSLSLSLSIYIHKILYKIPSNFAQVGLISLKNSHFKIFFFSSSSSYSSGIGRKHLSVWICFIFFFEWINTVEIVHSLHIHTPETQIYTNIQTRIYAYSLAEAFSNFIQRFLLLLQQTKNSHKINETTDFNWLRWKCRKFSLVNYIFFITTADAVADASALILTFYTDANVNTHFTCSFCLCLSEHSVCLHKFGDSTWLPIPKSLAIRALFVVVWHSAKYTDA